MSTISISYIVSTSSNSLVFSNFAATSLKFIFFYLDAFVAFLTSTGTSMVAGCGKFFPAILLLF